LHRLLSSGSRTSVEEIGAQPVQPTVNFGERGRDILSLEKLDSGE
jgi:hypothetical protein